MIRHASKLIGLFAVALLIAACDTAPRSDQDKLYLTDETNAAITRFRTVDPGIGKLMDTSYGYAVFPNVGKGGLGVGGAYGRGEVFQGGKRVGFCDLSQGTIGLQIGGQSYREIILFQDKGSFERFTHNELAFAAQATAVAAKEGAAADADYKDGVIVFSDPIGGLMAEASIGGQHFSFVPLAASAK